MLTYSVAIRTLGTAGDKFRRELESISMQTVQPEKVIAYIAEGYPRPDFQIGKEIYVPVYKGMVAQRALHYDDIDSDVIFFLDDDVWLAPDAAEKMLRSMEAYKADAVGLDVFRNHELSLKSKLWAALSNLVVPHHDPQWAFKIRRNGSFSYLTKIEKDFYRSHSCAGPAFMIKKEVYKQLHFDDELWLDKLGYAWNDDTLESYKIHKNGYCLGVLFNTGCLHIDAKTSAYNKKTLIEKIRLRSKASFLIWHRAIFSSAKKSEKVFASISISIKVLCQLAGHCLYSVIKLNPVIACNYLKGLNEGIKFIKSEDYKNLAPYVDKKS